VGIEAGLQHVRTVDLVWRGRVSKKHRRMIVQTFRQFYPQARDSGESLRLRALNNDTKYIWLFMFIKAFSDIR
jgi:hypothetical protein